MEQMSPDGMHTIADFISHVIDMLSGKQNTLKVKACENSFHRFEEVWPSEEIHQEGEPDEHSIQPKKKRKREDNKAVSNPSTSSTPWSLSKEQLSIANERASSIVYTNLQEITPGPHFTKPWTLRTMNSKLQFVTSGGFEWCIKGLLPPQQETTLSKLCNVIKRITSPQLFIADLPSLQADTHEALALFERDFPLSMQNLTTHLIHHIVDDLSRYGPMHGRWLFPYERANAWITRQCLRKGMEESTVMETYVVYDWCVFMILSGRFDPSKLFNSDKTLVRVSQHIMDNVKEGLSITATVNSKNNEMRASLLTQEMESYMMTFYVQIFKLSTIYGFSKTVAESHSTLDITDDSGRRLCYIGENYRGKKPPSLVKILGNNKLCYGQVSFFLKHSVCGKEEHWLIIDIYPIAERNEKYHVVEGKIIGKKLFHMSVVSKPLVYVKNGDTRWILNAE